LRCRSKKDSQTFSIILGGGYDDGGRPIPPASIVPAFTGLDLRTPCLGFCPPGFVLPLVSSIFSSIPDLPDPGGGGFPVVTSGTPLDLDQDGQVDLMLVRVNYYRPPMTPQAPGPDELLGSREYILGARIYGGDIFNDPGHCFSEPSTISVSGTNAIPVSFSYSYLNGASINGWVTISNGVLTDYGYNPTPGAPITLGEKPQGMNPNSDRQFDYEVADLSSLLARRPVVFLRHERIRDKDGLTIVSTLMGSPGQLLMRRTLDKLPAAILRQGEMIPKLPPEPIIWHPDSRQFQANHLDFQPIRPMTFTLGWVDMDLDGTVRKSSPWPGGFVAFREQGITWMHLSAGNVPQRLAGGHSVVAGGVSDYSRRGLSDTKTGEWSTKRDPVDLNRDGTADFMLLQTRYVSRNLSGALVLDGRHLALEQITPTPESTLILGRREVIPGRVYRSGVFLDATPKSFPVRFASSAGMLSGEVLVLDPTAGRISTRYEPFPYRTLEYGELPSVGLNIWRMPLAGLRVTWPMELRNYVLELHRAGGTEGWLPVSVVSPGIFDLPPELNESALFRLRRQ